MTIKDYHAYIVNTYSLNNNPKEQKELYSLFEEVGEDYGFEMSTDFEPDDVQIRELGRELYLTFLEENKYSTVIQPLIITLPIGRSDAFRAELSSYKLIIIDSQAIKFFGNIAHIIINNIPKYGNKLTPSKDDHFNREDIIKICKAINNYDYDVFKKTFLYSYRKSIILPYIVTDKNIEQLRDSMLLFLIGHEFAHVLLGHQRYYNYDTLYGLDRNWEKETEADIIGYELMYKTMSMSKEYHDVEHKAEFNLGFEIYFKFLGISELFSLIFMESADYKKNRGFSGTHPDADGSRLDMLRRIVLARKQKEINRESDDAIYSKYIMDISNQIFDSFQKRLIEEIVFLAAILDKQYKCERDYLAKLKEKFKEFQYNAITGSVNTEIPGFDEWKNGDLTKAVCKYLKGNYKRKFYRVISTLHCYEYEKYYFRMFSSVGTGKEFAEGISYLDKKMFMDAEEPLKKYYDNESNDPLVRFALGYAYSKIGEIYLLNSKKCKQKEELLNIAIQYCNDSMEISPLVRRETFMNRSIAYRKLRKYSSAFEDNLIYKTLNLVPNSRERGEDFVNKRTKNLS